MIIIKIDEVSTKKCQTFRRKYCVSSFWTVDGGSKPPGEVHHRISSSRTPFKSVVGDIDNNKRPTIIKEIAHVHFSALTVLNLTSNNIDSIEGLCGVRMPL